MDDTMNLLYRDDFLMKIRDVDATLSQITGNNPVLVLAYKERPELLTGMHLINFASYYPKFEVPHIEMSSTRLKLVGKTPVFCFPAYTIYTSAVDQYVERTLERSTLSGNGDSAIREFWGILAIALVRLRVVEHPGLFPGTKLRTVRDMVKHRFLFTENNNEIEALRIIENDLGRQMSRGVFRERDIDLFWTIQLYAHAINSGKTYEEATAYIAGC